MSLKLVPSLSLKAHQLIVGLLVFSFLTVSSFKGGVLAPKEKCLAPRSNAAVLQLKSPLPGAVLEEVLVSDDPALKNLARTVLKKQKRSKGLIYSFAAAFITAISVIGQEAILRNANMIDFLMLQPLLMSSLFGFLLLMVVGTKDFFKRMFGFFPSLWSSSSTRWYLLAVVSHQVFRNFIFFYTLPKITSTGINMIAAITVFLTPFFELMILGVNKFKWKYFLAYILIFWGVVGYKMTSIASGILVLMVFGAYVLSSFESVIRKKVIEQVGDFGRTHSFTLVFLAWYYGLSFLFWIGMWFGVGDNFLGELLPALKGGSWMSLLNFLLGPLHIVILLTAGGLVAARYLEQKTRTIPQFPVSFLEAIRHTRIVFTAVIVAGVVYLSSFINIPVFEGFTYPTAFQWFFIPIILGGVMLLAFFQRKEETQSHTSEGNHLLNPEGEILTVRDWERMVVMMRNHYHGVKNPSRRAKKVWQHFAEIKEDVGFDSIELSRPLSEAENYWRREIEQFTPSEKLIFLKAREIKGLRIGVDLDGVIVPLFDDYSYLNVEQLSSESSRQYRQRIALRPGIKPFIIGLMVHNHVEIDTASSQSHVEKLAESIPFFSRLKGHPQIQIKTQKEMLQAVTAFITFKEVQILGNAKVIANNIMLSNLEANNLYRNKQTIKLPDQLGLDVLIEDNPFLKKFLANTKISDPGKLIEVRSYDLVREERAPFRTLGRLQSFKYKHNYNPAISRTSTFEDETGYETEVLSVMTWIEQLQNISPGSRKSIINGSFLDLETAI